MTKRKMTTARKARKATLVLARFYNRVTARKIYARGLAYLRMMGG
jgi:hypothetical protein